MAAKKHTAKPAVKNDDTVVYKVMAALLLACLECLVLQNVCKVYLMIDHMEAVKSALGICIWVFAALAAASFVCCFVFRKRRELRFAGLLIGLNLLACAAACVLLYRDWTAPAMVLYFAFFALAVLISVFLLYQPEFALITAVNIVAGFGFYLLSKFGSFGGRALAVHLVMAICFVLSLAIAFFAAKQQGFLSIGKNRFCVLLLGSALPVSIAALLWLLCQLAGLLLGGFFYYCCIFAALALELVAAFYFTIKLK